MKGAGLLSCLFLVLSASLFQSYSAWHFICLFAHFVVPIRRLDELMKDAVVCVDAMGESRDLFERREDALGMSILGVRQEFNIIGFARESRQQGPCELRRATS